MQQQVDSHLFTGMQRDISVSKHSTNYLYDALNIRLTAREGSTLLSLTNERGPKDLLVQINGEYLGHCTINEYLIVFSTDSNKEIKRDYITRINLDIDNPNYNENKIKILYKGNLNFSIEHPIEAISSYENAHILKVYWTDDYNQPRLINIAPYNDTHIETYNSNSFDFVKELQLTENVTVSKLFGSGEFPAGVILYAFTYFNKYGLESNIFHTTNLHYISYTDRGASPEEKVATSFRIEIDDADPNFEYIRVYSILRTSINSVPIVKKLEDIPIKNSWTLEVLGAESRQIEAFIINVEYDLKGTIDTDFVLTPKGDYVNIKVGILDMEFVTLKEFLLKENLYTKYKSTDIDCPKPIGYFSSIAWQIFNNKTDPFDVYKIDLTKLNKFQVLRGAFKGEKYVEYGTWYNLKWTELILIGILGELVVIILDFNKAFLELLLSIENPTEYLYTQFHLKYRATFIDTGTKGEDINPTELLYKGGQLVIAKTIEQKDGTLFLGNLELKRPDINDIKKDLLDFGGINDFNNISKCVSLVKNTRRFITASKGDLKYINTLSSPEGVPYEGILGFKSNEYYRLGLQFLYKDGTWTEPCWVGDRRMYLIFPSINEDSGEISIPEFNIILPKNIVEKASTKGYKKVRALYVSPTLLDRTIICLGIGNSTMYRNVDRNSGHLYALSSWLFRPANDYIYNVSQYDRTLDDGGGATSFVGKLDSLYDLPFENKDNIAPYIRNTEIMGKFNDDEVFKIDLNLITFHSPDITFDDLFYSLDTTNTFFRRPGYVRFTKTFGDTSILTGYTLALFAKGVINYTIRTTGCGALISGLMYEDSIVADKEDGTFKPFNDNPAPGNFVYWPVYMWHKSGSINNDVSRSGQTSTLIKKNISNYRLGSESVFELVGMGLDVSCKDVLMFTSDLLQNIKIDGNIYRGNIDTSLVPSEIYPFYLVENLKTDKLELEYLKTAIPESKLAIRYPTNPNSHGLIRLHLLDNILQWDFAANIGKYTATLSGTRDSIRMKYKSTPHIVASTKTSIYEYLYNPNGKTKDGKLPILELTRSYDKSVMFLGISTQALKANEWIPCGPSIYLDKQKTVEVPFKWGDTYFLRFECLKTYPFTFEDENQVTEVASFLCETRVNIDGRYDRNRGVINNHTISPANFNLLNPVYSQLDNFFTYRILDEDFYKINKFPNLITWTKEKHFGADVDLWTNITLASIYDMDGSKGLILSLNTFEDNIYCFQDKGISAILFNSRVQIPTSDGVPIEITNSYKVDGYRYISDGVGCTNKWTIKETPTGIYFIDSVSSNLYQISDGITDISTSHNMSTWCKTHDVDKIVYDDVNHDVYLVNKDEALCYSEVLTEFTSRMSYGSIDLLGSYKNCIFTLHNSKLYQFGKGLYNIFFGNFKPWSINFISNGISNLNDASAIDKVFSNLEYRMDRYSYDSATDSWDNLHFKSLDYIRAYNEYQDTGEVNLTRTLYKPSNLLKQFRIWRVNIPRDNIYKRDRIRNTWCNIELGVKTENTDKVLLHDMNVLYYI